MESTFFIIVIFIILSKNMYIKLRDNNFKISVDNNAEIFTSGNSIDHHNSATNNSEVTPQLRLNNLVSKNSTVLVKDSVLKKKLHVTRFTS